MNLISVELKSDSKTSESGRVILDQGTKEMLIKMVLELKAQESCIRLSPSKFVCWIIGRYFEHMFANDQEAIIKAHFNSKEYLRKTINTVGSESDLATVLEDMLYKIRSEEKRSTRRPKKAIEKDPHKVEA